MIAVTGAAGKTGLAIVQALAARGVVVRGLAHSGTGAAKILAAGAAESVVGELADGGTVEKLLRGVRALYHICPNMHPDEVTIGATVLACAQAAGLEHLVYHSVLHPQTAAMPHHWHKLLVEERIFASGLPFTILQPAAYMQNLASYWQAVRQTGIYAVPYPPATRLSLIDVRDVAEVAGRVLTEPGHEGATYELVGTVGLRQQEIAEVMGAQMGRAVSAAELPLDLWEQQARAAGLHDYAVETLRKMFRYYAEYGLVGNPGVLQWLLGRPPRSLEAFIAETAAHAQGTLTADT